MNKLKVIILTLVILMGLSLNAQAAYILQPDDFVGFSFQLLAMGCLAATVFFFLEQGSVATGWKTSITVAGIITGITFVHSIYTANIWVTTGDSPIVYKYIDWLITMPLLMVQFYLILSAVRKVSSIIFWKLLIGTIIMVCGGYAGQAGYILPILGFFIWMAGWIYILYEVFSGDVAKIVSRSSNEDLIIAFGRMKMIITIGWSIYPLGYVFGYLTGGIDSNTLNVIYNFTDFINKIAFGLVIWTAAKQN